MMTIHEVSRITGLTVRTLQYYDSIGLLSPDSRTESGYRLYDESALEKLRHIMIFRELEVPLKEIKKIMDDPDYDGKKILEQQIELLKLKKEHIENLITLAIGIKLLGVRYMDFKYINNSGQPTNGAETNLRRGNQLSDTKRFSGTATGCIPGDKTKLDEYSKQVKKQWGDTPQFRQFAEKSKNRTDEDDKRLAEETMELFTKFGAMRELEPSDEAVQAQVKKLQNFFNENFYDCTDKLLLGLGRMYAGGGEFTENIDSAGGKGTAEFVYRAIEFYCSNKGCSNK